MTLSITIGWWLVPTIVTIACFGWFFWETRRMSAMTGLEAMFNAYVAAASLAGTLVVSLIAWVLYLAAVVILT